jgi:hypothetical protein
MVVSSRPAHPRHLLHLVPPPPANDDLAPPLAAPPRPASLHIKRLRCQDRSTEGDKLGGARAVNGGAGVGARREGLRGTL